MAERVLSVVRELGKARYKALCSRLPYHKESITYALKRLKAAGKVRLDRDEHGEFWSVHIVRRGPTESH